MSQLYKRKVPEYLTTKVVEFSKIIWLYLTIDGCQKKAFIRKWKQAARKDDGGAEQADVSGAETDAITDLPLRATLISNVPFRA